MTGTTRRHLNILVAEDDEFTREFMEAMLRQRGHEVVMMRDGRQLLEAVVKAEPRFDLLLVDAQMPHVDGMEATRQLRRTLAGSTLPIVCVSARASGRSEAEGREAGVDAYVTKPCWDEQLFAVIRDVLQARGVLTAEEEI